jgi:hypothetical protein
MDEKVAKMPRERPTMFDPGYLSPDDLIQRAKVTKEFVSAHFSDATGGARLPERFTRNTNGVR